MKYLLTTVISLISAAVYCQQPVDLIIYGKTYTADSSFNQTDGVVIDKGKIVFTGDKTVITQQYATKQTLNLPHAAIYPGFIDAHCHFSGYALDAYKCDLVGTTSFNDVIKRLVTYEQTNKLTWIYARGWDQNDWTNKQFPTKDTLDKLFPDKPVILKRIDGHAVLANQKALDLAGVNQSTAIPEY